MSIPAFADVLASLVSDDLDMADVLAHLVAECALVTGAGAVAILAREGSAELGLLTATSHRATELEILQLQRHEGPCVEAILTGRPVAAGGPEIAARWSAVGPALLAAGFARVEAFPMRWQAGYLGSLNILLVADEPVDPGTGQAFADMATLAIAQSVAISAEQVQARLHEALISREVVEQAKGALAQAQGLDLEAAYAELLRLAGDADNSLTQAAREVVRRRGRPA